MDVPSLAVSCKHEHQLLGLWEEQTAKVDVFNGKGDQYSKIRRRLATI